MFRTTDSFDGTAATTRSLLGYGVLAGLTYLTIGIVLAVAREGFRFADHALSLLMLGDHGWMQRANLAASGIMMLLAAAGFRRASTVWNAAPETSAIWLAGYGICLLGGAAFVPDPVAGFPPGTADGSVEATIGGVLRLASGAIGFICVVATAIAFARWHRGSGDRANGLWALGCGVVVLVAFVAGAGLAQNTVGIVLLWIAVITAWLWIAVTSAATYKRIPHPALQQREAAA